MSRAATTSSYWKVWVLRNRVNSNLWCWLWHGPCFKLSIFLFKLCNALSQLFVEVEKAFITPVCHNISSLECAMTNAAGQLNFSALSIPVLFDCLNRCLGDIFFAAALETTRNCLSATLPMLLPHFVLVAFVARFAVKLTVVERLNDEAIHFITQVEVDSAVWASVVALLPLGDAGATTKLVAILALFWLLHYLQADCASEVLIQL